MADHYIRAVTIPEPDPGDIPAPPGRPVEEPPLPPDTTPGAPVSDPPIIPTTSPVTLSS